MDPGAILARILDRPRVAVVRRVFDAYGHAAGGLLANGLAFSALFAAVPAVLLMLGLLGWLAAGDLELREQLTSALVAALPPLADLIRLTVDAATDGAALTSLLGVIGLVWTVSQLVGAVDVAFARIFSDIPERDLFRRTIRGFLVIALLAAAIVALMIGLGLVAALDSVAGAEGSLARVAFDLLSSPPALVAAACVVVLIGYRKLPPQPPSWTAIVPPAVVVGATLIVLTQAFTYLVPRLVGVAELAGSLASGFVTLAWLSLSFQALLLGAAWVRVRDEIVPERAAAAAPPVDV